jgi:hypothetical protein
MIVIMVVDGKKKAGLQGDGGHLAQHFVADAARFVRIEGFIA